MMGAVQPFISGAISKTVNLPEKATVDEVAQLIVEAWRLGVKAIAIYRDNCKVAQPLSGQKDERRGRRSPARRRPRWPPASRSAGALPEDRTEIGRKFRVGDYEGYIHVGLYEDGTPGDIFVDIAKDGHDDGRPDELADDRRLDGPPVRRAAGGLRLEALAHALRAERA